MDIKELSLNLQQLNYTKNKEFFITNYKKCLEEIKNIDEKLNIPDDTIDSFDKTIDELFIELNEIDENDYTIENIVKMKKLINNVNNKLTQLEFVEHN